MNALEDYREITRASETTLLGSITSGRVRQGDDYTNTIEGFFGNLKTGMRGAYKHVSDRWIQSYLDEYAWRHNARGQREGLFEQLLRRAAS